MSNDERMQEFIDSHVAVIQPLERECALARWESALTGTDEATSRAEQITSALRKVYANPSEYALLKELSARGFSDPLIARQHNVLLRMYLAEQMPPEVIDRLAHLEAEVDQEYNNFRAEVDGRPLTDNEVKKILRESADSNLRRAAWEAGKELGAVVTDRVLEMVRTRNEAARNLGFSDYYDMAFRLDELDETRVFAIFDNLIAQSDPYWDAWKADFDRQQAARFGIDPNELQPWHYTDPFFQETPPGDLDLDRCFAGKDIVALTERFFAAIGLPVETMIERSDLFERDGKNQHAFCTDIDREGDVRVLCNVVADEQWMGTMLHEYGHAVYDYYNNASLPFLLRTIAHTLSTEAIAELMGRFSKDPVWLRLYAGVPAGETQSLSASAREELRVQFLISTRWIVTMAKFEREMYRNPDRDLNSMWWDTVEKYQGVRRPEGRNSPDWAAKLHLALAPVYYQNYLLGEIMAAQLLHHLKTNVLEGQPEEVLFTSQKVGEWLKENVFAVGACYPWEEALRRATGEGLNPSYFAAQLRN